MEANQERLYADVEFLTSILPARNYRNMGSLNKAADYVLDEFKKLDCQTTEQRFLADRREYRNIIASFGPPDAERIIVGAHYDVFGDQPGADDNASAVAGLLETARLLHQHRPQLQHRLDFVAYPLEEPPFFASKQMGSAVHAKSLHDAKAPVRAMLCYEMIGYFSDEPGSQKFPNEKLAAQYPNTGNFITVVGKQGQEAFTQRVQTLIQSYCHLDVERINLPESMGLAGLSDHRNYWDYGYDAVMINDTSFLRNPNYHQVSDTIDTLDFERMAEVVDGVYGALLNL
ncbi:MULTISPECIES: M28 family peptidase [Hymenobacter]|uniref:M28 family peptidase n=1 Tax=Hymenobacter jejuensis TaxID=2502781 RepID=A0A5B7ZY93_9BACT|nr:MULTISPECIES: M28 family peptidase [Hymenobacter]MBC6988210.1 M28 family peptidase [Hymenobacter sp. BT491]QDA59423.1 M28 family peptidase [Hymenobacter jejuensis]